MADEVLDETVRCEQCDDELIKMFKDDHVCDPDKIKVMKKNAQGELAEPLLVGPPQGMRLWAESFKPNKSEVIQEGPLSSS